MDVIAIEDLRAYGRHGVTAQERSQPQAIEITLKCEIDLSRAQRSDELEDTVDYEELHARLSRAVEHSSFALLESLAGHLLETVFEDSRIGRAEITLRKPRRLSGATPAITLARDNPKRSN